MGRTNGAGGTELSTKTSQLQIRISPEQKAVLKSLAGEAGTSVSEYVLARVLPAPRLAFERRVEALRGASRRDEALADLAEYLRDLADESFRQAVVGPGPSDLPPLLRNYVAAGVEREARYRELEPPEWTRDVEPQARAHFAWDLRSLRPYLVRATPPDFKRRRIFVAAPDDPRVDGFGEERSDLAGGGPESPEALIAALDDALREEGVIAELCVVGGAVLRVVFAAAPETRRPAAVFGDPGRADRAERRIAEERGLAPGWVEPAVRELTGPAAPAGHVRPSDLVHEGRYIRILPAPPDYVLAMRCAALSFGPESGTDGDIRYLLRSLGLRDARDAMEVVDGYLNPRQRPTGLERHLADLLG